MHRLNAGGRIPTFYHSIQEHLAGPWPSYVAGLTQDRKPERNSILYIPPVMTRRVGPERSIVDRARGAKIGCSGGGEGRGGEGKCIENVSHNAVEAQGYLARARVGCGGRGADNSSQSRPFLLPLSQVHRYIR